MPLQLDPRRNLLIFEVRPAGQLVQNTSTVHKFQRSAVARHTARKVTVAVDPPNNPAIPDVRPQPMLHENIPLSANSDAMLRRTRIQQNCPGLAIRNRPASHPTNLRGSPRTSTCTKLSPLSTKSNVAPRRPNTQHDCPAMLNRNHPARQPLQD